MPWTPLTVPPPPARVYNFIYSTLLALSIVLYHFITAKNSDADN